MVKRCLGVLAAMAIGGAIVAGPARATTTDQRVCPIPALGVDPDTVTIVPSSTPAGAGVVAYTVTASESPGEASHNVALLVKTSSSDGGSSSTAEPLGKKIEKSPTTVHLVLLAGHHYSVDWVAGFDNGLHVCTSAAPGESAFEITT
jgi:hypothetical protein